MSQSMEVVIIGAGTTGLLLAHALKQVNIKTTIFERETPQTYLSRPREWGMTLHWGNENIVKALPSELQARIREAWADPHFQNDVEGCNFPAYSAHIGDELFNVPIPDGMRVSRRKLRKLLAEGLAIHYGKRLVSIASENDVTVATFEDGMVVSGDLIAGCDGSHSLVREALVGREAAECSYLQYSLFNFPCNYGAEVNKMIGNKCPLFFAAYHPDGWMYMLSKLDIPDPEDPGSWSFQTLFSFDPSAVQADLSTREGRVAFLKSKATDCVEPWRTVLRSIPDDLNLTEDRISIWRPVDWSNSPLAGKVTLAGDAAHTMAPYRGQGFNQGLEDGVKLRDRLAEVADKKVTLKDTIRAYETEMRERTLGEIAVSEAQGRFQHDYNGIVNSPIAQIGIKKSNIKDVETYTKPSLE